MTVCFSTTKFKFCPHSIIQRVSIDKHFTMMGFGNPAANFDTNSTHPVHVFACNISSAATDDWKLKCKHIDVLLVSSSSWSSDPSHLKILLQPFITVLGDLRSQLVKAGCSALVLISSQSGDTMRALMKDLLPSFVALQSQTVKVMQGIAEHAFITIVSNVKFRQGIAYVVDCVRRLKQKDARASCVNYLNAFMEEWDRDYLKQDKDGISKGIARALEDPAQTVRIVARDCFTTFVVTFGSER